ncbi:hypothetical protein [Dysgonomonas termitidis]|uniref:Uncharacterized protein n=1 Tax=Dysgonomonas termitidis TaxID=1516126 RepID=A0ABV9KV61_9BACT
MSEIDKFAENIGRKTQEARQAQIRFVECVSVDWENKTMDARGTGDGGEYRDVALGFGYTDIKPAVGSTCLIGIIDGQEVVTFLINAEDVELVETKAGKIIFNGGGNDGLVNAPELTKRINALENDNNMLKQVFAAWLPAPNDGGAALKTAAAAWAGQQIIVTKQDDIEDNKITH